ncbi:hypothetical protein [Bifidobacterium sp. SO1]|uniref:hypothetical protein n=1 Tax=Bifidobacterium sp. SO1 TaxID=2809029 RepID=UPI001BDBE145|nr:hypothetical protein [Bifidobacterium sp. SO1]MBT1162161.1 hypothetical protein [Bifidobacterium sp. SO1]
MSFMPFMGYPRYHAGEQDSGNTLDLTAVAKLDGEDDLKRLGFTLIQSCRHFYGDMLDRHYGRTKLSSWQREDGPVTVHADVWQVYEPFDVREKRVMFYTQEQAVFLAQLSVPMDQMPNITKVIANGHRDEYEPIEPNTVDLRQLRHNPISEKMHGFGLMERDSDKSHRLPLLWQIPYDDTGDDPWLPDKPRLIARVDPEQETIEFESKVTGVKKTVTFDEFLALDRIDYGWK